MDSQSPLWKGIFQQRLRIELISLSILDTLLKNPVSVSIVTENDQAKIGLQSVITFKEKYMKLLTQILLHMGSTMY